MPQPYLVFISHSARDTWVARQIAKEITACGAVPFLDEIDIEVGAKFEEEIRDFLWRAHEVVVLVTPWALNRPYVSAELGAAWLRHLPIIPVLHGTTPKDLQSNPDLLGFVRERDMIDVNQIDVYLAQLKKRVEAEG